MTLDHWKCGDGGDSSGGRGYRFLKDKHNRQ